MAKISIIVFLILSTGKEKVVRNEIISHWNYQDQNAWCHLSGSKCCKHSQSPIALSTKEKIYSFPPFRFSHYDEITGKFVMANNGHTIALVIGNMTHYPTVEGGGLPNTYRLHSIHFHWGSTNKHGSEHIIDNKPAPLEMHLVHINVKFPTGRKATKSTEADALAVLGIMYHADDERANPALSPITKKLKSVTYKQLLTKIPSFNVGKLLPTPKNRFFRYLGSLTTPNCSEIVVWTVFEHPSYISHNELGLFRAIKESLPEKGNELLVNNYRALQPLGSRELYLAEEDPKCTAQKHSHTSNKLAMYKCG